jgi:hypothetical protein
MVYGLVEYENTSVFWQGKFLGKQALRRLIRFGFLVNGI